MSFDDSGPSRNGADGTVCRTLRSPGRRLIATSERLQADHAASNQIGGTPWREASARTASCTVRYCVFVMPFGVQTAGEAGEAHAKPDFTRGRTVRGGFEDVDGYTSPCASGYVFHQVLADFRPALRKPAGLTQT